MATHEPAAASTGKIPRDLLNRWAADASADVRSARAMLAGRAPKGAVGDRLRAAALKLGIVLP